MNSSIPYHGPRTVLDPARRLPDSPRPASPDCRRGEFPRSCPTPKPAPPGHDNPTPRIPDLIVTGPRVRPPDSTRRPTGEPVEDAEDRGPGAAWARRVGWHQGDSVPHVDRAQRCPIPRRARAGVPSTWRPNPWRRPISFCWLRWRSLAGDCFKRRQTRMPDYAPAASAIESREFGLHRRRP